MTDHSALKRAAEREILAQTMPGDETFRKLAAPSRIAGEEVPERECFWLLERNVSPPQYVSLGSAGWDPDPWIARRFKSEREAHDYWRLMGEIDRGQFRVVEHMFINKPTPTVVPYSDSIARAARTRMKEEAAKVAEKESKRLIESAKKPNYGDAALVNVIEGSQGVALEKIASAIRSLPDGE